MSSYFESILMLLKSQTQMVLNPRALVLLHILVWSLPAIFSQSYGDIPCLKSFRESLEDPLNNLNSWTLDNLTEGSICEYVGVTCWDPFANVGDITQSNNRRTRLTQKTNRK